MPIFQSAITLLDQLKKIIAQLSNEEFSMPLTSLSGSSIGGHVRHTLEFFLCLSDAKTSGKINYDLRKHDKCVEQDTALALSIIESIQRDLAQKTSDFPLTMEAGYEIDQEQTASIPSSYFRELAYNIEHAIHHMALIKVGLTSHFDTVSFPEHFGIASSTVRYQKSQLF